MANIYIREEVLQRIDKHCATPKGEIDRSDFINYLIDAEEKKNKK